MQLLLAKGRKRRIEKKGGVANWKGRVRQKNRLPQRPEECWGDKKEGHLGGPNSAAGLQIWFVCSPNLPVVGRRGTAAHWGGVPETRRNPRHLKKRGRDRAVRGVRGAARRQTIGPVLQLSYYCRAS